MPVSAALKRLLRIRDLEQEQHRVALSSALSELHSLEEALAAASDRERAGRNQFASGVRAGESLVRHSALIESAIGEQHQASLAPVLSRAEAEAARRRHAFLSKRTELRQAETLIAETTAAEAIEAARQRQQHLDDWYLARIQRNTREASTFEAAAAVLEDADPLTASAKEFSNPSATQASAQPTRMKAVQE